MEKFRTVFILVCLLLVIFSQDDTLWLLNGKRIIGTYHHEDSQYIYFSKTTSPKKNKTKKIISVPIENIYSVVRVNEDEETIYYTPEPYERFSSVDYKAYLLGLGDAKERYFPYGIVALGVIYNTFGGFVGARNFLVLLVPWTYTLIVYLLPVPSFTSLWREPLPSPGHLYEKGFRFGIKQKRVAISVAVGLTFTTIGIIAGNYYRSVFDK